MEKRGCSDEKKVRFLYSPLEAGKMEKPTVGNPVVVDAKAHVVSIYFDPESQELSKSGKSVLLGTSRGFASVEGISVSYNIIRPINEE